MKNIRKILATITHKEPWTIRACVAQEALGHAPEDIDNFFCDLANYGCVTGMVWSLIYYCDTHKFFDTHYYEIMGIVEDLANQGLKIELTDEDLKNRLAWLAFEEVAMDMAHNDLWNDD